MFLSFSFSLHFPLSKNKINKILKKIYIIGQAHSSQSNFRVPIQRERERGKERKKKKKRPGQLLEHLEVKE